MVTLTLGKKWQAQIEEIANLKSEKAELEEDHKALVQKFAQVSGELARTQYKHQSLLKEFEALKNTSASCEQSESQAKEHIHTLADENAQLRTQLEDARASMGEMQCRMDELSRQNQIQNSLIDSLKEELSQTESLKDSLEKSKQELTTENTKKHRQLELAEKAKEHSRRHIDILVKEKDRLLTKTEASVMRSEPQVIMSSVAAPSESWTQVETQRLKNTIKQLQEHSQGQQQEIERLKKENWNLVNRLRNKR